MSILFLLHSVLKQGDAVFVVFALVVHCICFSGIVVSIANRDARDTERTKRENRENNEYD